jgi:glutamate synthase domain-containing protein 3
VTDDPALVQPDAVLSVPEIRHYDTINAELVQLLDMGKRWIRLDGAAGQRLLASRLSGTWHAVIEIVGNAGPEFAAQNDAPGLTVLCRGSVRDGAASQLRAGCVIVQGDAGPAFGYHLIDGTALVFGAAGARAGLGQQGGSLFLLGGSGPLSGERQSGGRVFLGDGQVGPHLGLGRRGGRLIALSDREPSPHISTVDATDRPSLASARDLLRRLSILENPLLDPQ